MERPKEHRCPKCGKGDLMRDLHWQYNYTLVYCNRCGYKFKDMLTDDENYRRAKCIEWWDR